MKKMAEVLLLSACLYYETALAADDVEYRPFNEKYASTWNHFYSGDHEPELDDPLIKAGKNMTLAICQAIKHKDMRLRRYAIGALGFIGDKRALPTLETILKSQEEIDYFRGDALHAIYQIDRNLGKKYAEKYGSDNKHLKRLKKDIQQDAEWLTEPTEE